MQVLAVIPARGGSKGIPKKNILPIGGIPLIARTVSTVKRCKLIDTVIVSTDDNEIAEIAKNYGAGIVHRPPKLANDEATSESAVLHACETWSRKTGEKYDLILLVQNTNPFHDPRDMRKVINTVQSGAFHSCITVVPTHKYFWRETRDGWEMPFQTRGPRQQRDLWCEEAGSLYCVKYDHFSPDGNLFPTPVGVIKIPWWRGFEIDEQADIILAELLCEKYDLLAGIKSS